MDPIKGAKDIMGSNTGQDTSMAMVALLVSSGVSMAQNASDQSTMAGGLAMVFLGILLAYMRGASKPHRQQQLDSEPPKRLPPGGA